MQYNFSDALTLLKKGYWMQRAGWNGKGMYLFLVKGDEWTFQNGKKATAPLLPFIAMFTADQKTVPWLASQTDMLAEDWQFADMPFVVADEDVRPRSNA